MLREGFVGNSGLGINIERKTYSPWRAELEVHVETGHPLRPRSDYSAQNCHPSGDEEVLPTTHSKVKGWEI